jgi:hypothetical protein
MKGPPGNWIVDSRNLRNRPPAAFHPKHKRCECNRSQGGSFRGHRMITIARREEPSVKSEYEEAKGKDTQKEKYVAPRPSLAKRLRPLWLSDESVSRFIAPFAECDRQQPCEPSPKLLHHLVHDSRCARARGSIPVVVSRDRVSTNG